MPWNITLEHHTTTRVATHAAQPTPHGARPAPWRGTTYAACRTSACRVRCSTAASGRGMPGLGGGALGADNGAGADMLRDFYAHQAAAAAGAAA